MPKKTRAKIRRRLKRRYGLRREELGEIGAGHLEAPLGYREELLGELELARFRRSA